MSRPALEPKEPTTRQAKGSGGTPRELDIIIDTVLSYRPKSAAKRGTNKSSKRPS